MQIIPVIDIKNGLVVHARQGQRDYYAPIASKISPTADVFAVIAVFQQIFGFNVMYMADLNAITGNGNNSTLLTQALQRFPNIEFWLDSGYPLPTPELLTLRNYRPILGSESFTDATVGQIHGFHGNYILSLDHNAVGAMGAPSLFQSPAYWPDKVIIMSLPHVGSHNGPDFARLTHYVETYPEHRFIAAGGVRNTDDLLALQRIGVNRCLIASALHNGMIKPGDLAELQTKKYPD